MKIHFSTLLAFLMIGSTTAAYLVDADSNNNNSNDNNDMSFTYLRKNKLHNNNQNDGNVGIVQSIQDGSDLISSTAASMLQIKKRSNKKKRNNKKEEPRFGSIHTQVLVHGLDHDPSPEEIDTVERLLIKAYNLLHDFKDDNNRVHGLHMVDFSEETVETHQDHATTIQFANKKHENGNNNDDKEKKNVMKDNIPDAKNQHDDLEVITNHHDDDEEMLGDEIKKYTWSLLYLYLDGYIGFECFLCPREEDDDYYPYYENKNKGDAMMMMTMDHPSGMLLTAKATLKSAKSDLQDTFCALLKDSGSDNFLGVHDCFVLFDE